MRSNHAIPPKALLWSVFFMLVGICAPLSAGNVTVGDQFVDVTFEIEYETQLGQSVFVVGNSYHLSHTIGENSPASHEFAVKLEPSAYPLWRATIAINRGIDYEYQYIVREDGALRLRDGLNGDAITEFISASTPPADGPTPRRFISFEEMDTECPTSFVNVSRSGTGVSAAINPVAIPNTDMWLVPDMDWFGLDKILFVGGCPPGPPRLTYGEETSFSSLYQVFPGFSYWSLPPVSLLSAPRIAFHTDFSSSNLGNTRTIRVYLPRGYDTESNRRYPVLYMHDGQNVFAPGGAFGSWDVDISMTRMIERGVVPEMIVVGIDNTNDRFTEYTPPYQEIFGEMGRGDLYARFVIEEVAPFIESTYRTLPGREWRLVGGSSLGGLISAYMAWDFPDFAKRYLCMSPSFQLNEILSRFDQGEARPVILYFDSGDSGNSNDGLWNTLNARDILMKNGKYVLGRNLFHTIGYGDSHNEAAWRGRFPNALKTVFTADFLLVAEGDVNGDGCLNIADLVTLVNEKETGTALPALEKPRADRDGSGVIDDTDVAKQVADLLNQ